MPISYQARLAHNLEGTEFVQQYMRLQLGRLAVMKLLALPVAVLVLLAISLSQLELPSALSP